MPSIQKNSPLNGLAEGQVLQRAGSKGANVTLRGVASDAGAVAATISNSHGPLKGWRARRVGEAGGGKFAAELAGIPAGGPYKLELSMGKERVARVESFFVGDVWVLAGQSNMEGIALIEGCAEPHPLVRAFSMRREWRLATEPLHLLAESPDQCHALRQCTAAEGEALRCKATKGSGVGMFFAREMVRRSGVPQGLICAAHGGTSMTQWNPALKAEGGASQYGSMLLSVRATGQPVAGVLWYQGESDALPQDVPLYEKRMTELVAATRRDLSQPGLPWVTVQISRVYGLAAKREDIKAWNDIQELQRLLPKKIRNLETVAAIDLPLDDGIHIGVDGFPRLASRMARAAARLAYGDRRELPPPRLESVSKLRLKRGLSFTVDVAFANVVGGLRSGGLPYGFAILDGNGIDQAVVYKTTLHDNVVRLHLGVATASGLYLAYGAGRVPICNITDGRDEALPAFGPIPLEKPAAVFPFIREWKVTGVIPPPAPLAKIGVPDPAAHGGRTKTYTTDFTDEHLLWQTCKEGHAYFSSRIKLSEPMRLEFLMGYDGPFRLWLDGKPFYQDLKGINPIIMDEKRRLVSLPAGTHDLRVAMDINQGLAWGFCLRLRRVDVTRGQIESGDYAKVSFLA